MQSRLHDFGWIDNARSNQIAIVAFVCVEAFVLLHATNAIDHDAAVIASILSDVTQWVFQDLLDDANTRFFIADQFADFLESLFRTKECDAAARNDALCKCSSCRALGVFEQVLTFLHLCFGDRTDVDLSHTAGKFRQAFLKLLAIVIAVRCFDFLADLSNAFCDGVFLSAAANEDCVVAGDANFLDFPKIAQLNAFEVDAKIFKDHLAASENAKVTHDGFATIAVARSLHSTNLQDASHLVDDECGKCFAFDVFCNDQQWLL